MTDTIPGDGQGESTSGKLSRSSGRTCIRCAMPIESNSTLCHECGTPQGRFSLWKHESWPFWVSILTLGLVVGGLWIAVREISLLTETTQLMDKSVKLQTRSVDQMDSTIQLTRQEMALRFEELNQEREAAMQRVSEFIALNRPKLKVGPLNCRRSGDDWSLVLSIINQSQSRVDNLRESIIYADPNHPQQSPRRVSRDLGVLAPSAGLDDIHTDIRLERGVTVFRVELKWEWRELQTTIGDQTHAFFSAVIADTCNCMREVESAQLKALLEGQ